MNFYNREKLVKVTVNKAYPARWWSYEKEKKIMGFTIRKAGYYYWLWSEWQGTEIPEHHQIINGELHENPEVVLHYQNGHSKTYYFNTYEQAQKFAEEIVSTGTFIQ